MARSSNLKSDLKFMAKTTYATMFVCSDLAVLKLFCIFLERRKKKKENLSPLDLSASPQVKTKLCLRVVCMKVSIEPPKDLKQAFILRFWRSQSLFARLPC